MVHAVKKYRNSVILDQCETLIQTEQKAVRKIFESNANVQLFLNTNDIIPTGIKKWNDIFDNLDWTNIYKKCYKTTIDCKLKWFQIRLIHRLLPTNRYLYLRHINDNNRCSFCGREEETIRHLFWSCVFVKRFWCNVQNMLIEKCPFIVNLNLSEELVLFGHKENMFTDKVFDLILLSAKYFIYTNKFSHSIPNCILFLQLIKQRYQIEKFLSINQNQYHQFQLNWFPYEQLLM